MALEEGEGMGIASVTVNLIIASAGAGLLAFPFAMRKAGLVPGLLLCFFFGLMNIYSLRVLITHSLHSMSSPSPSCSRPLSYHDLMYRKLGKSAGHVANSSILFGIFGALIGFLIIIADLVCPVLETIVKDTPYAFTSERYFVIISFVVFVALPLSLLPSLKSLASSSVLAIVTVVFVVFVVIFRCSYSHDIASVSDYSTTRPESWWSTFEAMPIILFAFGCPLQTVAAIGELPSQLSASCCTFIMNTASGLTVSFCGLIYISVGVFGYIQFGSETDGVILDNYDSDDQLVNVARVLMAIHVALAYPVLFFPAQFSIVQLVLHGQLMSVEELETTRQTSDEDDDINCSLLKHEAEEIETEETSSLLESVESPSIEHKRRVQIVTSVAVGSVTAALAIIVPQVEIVFGFVGALVATTQVFLLPAALALHDDSCYTSKQKQFNGEKIINFIYVVCRISGPYVLILIGSIVAVTGTISYSIDLFSP